MKRIAFALLLLAGSCIWANAQQVGVNTDNPNPLAVLDIRNVSNGADSVSYRGVMVPRMSEVERNRINVLDPNNANGLFIYNTDEDCFNYYSRNQGQWKSLCGEYNGLAQFNRIYCDRAVKSMANLETGTPIVLFDQYAGVLVEVSKAGTYQISATPVNENGYYFYDSGVFLLPGLHFVKAFGAGTPIYNRLDSLNVYINGELVCPSAIPVVTSGTVNTPTFIPLCDSITVNGSYIVGETLNTNSNTIQVVLDVFQYVQDTPYRIRTDTVNGCYFEGTGVFSGTGVQFHTVSLYGNGIPQNMGTHRFTLYTNSNQQDNETRIQSCPFDINFAARRMRILGVGESATYYLGSTDNGMNKLINNTALFGLAPDSLVQFVDGFEIIQTSAGNAANIENLIANNNPDIIIIQYDWTGNASGASAANIDALVNFVNINNGVLILCSDAGYSAGGFANRSTTSQNIVRRIFGNETLTPTSETNDNTQPFASTEQSNAPVLNGPYNLRELSMARDYLGNFNFTATDGILNVTDLQVIAWRTTNNTTEARAFMHANKGFVFIGDGAPFAYQAGNTDPNNYPMKLTNDYFPTTGISGTTVTYNAHLFCNIMAWAIEYAQRNRP